MKNTKKIAIDARFYGIAGPGRYTKAIIDQLQMLDFDNKYIIFLKKETFNEFEPINKNFSKVLADYNWYSWSEQIFFLFTLLKHKPDLLYVPHFNIPVLYPFKIVTAIPDLIMHSFSTQSGTTLWKPYFLFKKFIYKLVVLIAVLKTKKNICPSFDVKNDFEKYYPFVDKNKFIVSYEGVDPDLLNKPDQKFIEETLNSFNVSEPFLLYVSSMYEHKNVTSLVEAFKLLVNKYGFKGQLVLIGKKDKFSEKIFDLICKYNLTSKVIMPGMVNFVTDSQVNAFRTKCLAYVFPSLKEGFSLTPLEAQFFDIPCIISDISCHKEIYSSTVAYFNPYSVDDIAKVINLVITDKKYMKTLINKGKENIKKYSWEITAKDTLKVFNNVLDA